MTFRRISLRSVVFTIAAALTVSACSSGPAPLGTIAPGAETSPDGLYRLDNSVFTVAYTKQDLDLSPYTAFIIDDVTVAYRKDPQGRTRNSPESNYALSESQMEMLKSAFHDAIEDALEDDPPYEVVTTPGPNVAELTAYLIDLEVRFPTDRAMRERVAVDSYGQVTMILEIRDSESNEILARVGDRGDPTQTTYELAGVNSAFVMSDVRRMFDHWAGTVRERLDQVRAVGAN